MPNQLAANKNLSAGQGLTSSNGYYLFTMQHDGNLVLYRVSDMHPLWASGTAGKGDNCVLSMQRDGNLVIYNPQNLPIWASNTSRIADNYHLDMQNDGNVVIYTSKSVPIWATNTVQRGRRLLR